MKHKLPPGPRGWPVIGNILEYRLDPFNTTMNAYKKFGPVFTFNFVGTPAVMFLGPEAQRYILVDQEPNFSWAKGYSNLHPLVGLGLLATDDPIHKQQRGLMAPAFHHKRVQDYLDTMRDSINNQLNSWHNGEIVEVAETNRQLTLDIIMRGLFGAHSSKRSERFAQHMTVALERLGFNTNPLGLIKWDVPFLPFGKLMDARRKLDVAVYDEITHRRQHPEENYNDIINDFMQTMNEDGEQMTDVQLRDQIVTLMVGGHETSTRTLTWAMYLLAEYPDKMAKMREEVLRVVGEGEVRLEHLRSLKYVDNVISETMRLYPPVWTLIRKCNEDFEFNGHHIPANTYVLYGGWVSQRIPEYFNNPNDFIPERFEDDRPAPFTFLPYGGGPRLCLGKAFADMEMKLMLAMLCQRFDLERAPGHEVIPHPTITLGQKDGVKLRMIARQPEMQPRIYEPAAD